MKRLSFQILTLIYLYVKFFLTETYDYAIVKYMKILAIADRPPREPLKDILARHTIDIICTLGDLDEFQIAALRNVTGIPKLGVYGNHDSGVYFDELGITNMHLATFTFNGYTFGGFEGSVRYKKDPYAKMYTQEEAEAALASFPRVDIMLTHCPPYGIHDETEIAHQGFAALRTYIEEKKPGFLLHGHTYPEDDSIVTNYGGTKVIYVHADRIIDIL
jgi:Icc-related predicted phosphoesterase